MNSINTNAFEPRSGLTRTLTYRPEMKTVYICCNIFSIIVILYSAYAFFINYNISDIQVSIISLVFQAIIPIILLYLANTHVKDMTETTINLGHDGIQIDKKGEKILLAFSEIEKLNIKMNSMFGAQYEVQLKSGKKFIFNNVLERSEYILESIFNFNNNLISTDQLIEFRRSAIISDHSWTRFFDYRWEYVVVMFFAWPIILKTAALLAGVNQQNDILSYRIGLSFLGLFIINLVVAGFIWMFVESLLSYKKDKELSKNPQALKRDLVLEKKIKKLSFTVQSLVMILVFLINI